MIRDCNNRLIFKCALSLFPTFSPSVCKKPLTGYFSRKPLQRESNCQLCNIMVRVLVVVVHLLVVHRLISGQKCPPLPSGQHTENSFLNTTKIHTWCLIILMTRPKPTYLTLAAPVFYSIQSLSTSFNSIYEIY